MRDRDDNDPNSPASNQVAFVPSGIYHYLLALSLSINTLEHDRDALYNPPPGVSLHYLDICEGNVTATVDLYNLHKSIGPYLHQIPRPGIDLFSITISTIIIIVRPRT